MAQRTIQTFIGNYIAFYRPNKRTYSIISYNHPRRIWIPNNEQIQNGTVSLNKMVSELVNVNIVYKQDKKVECKTDGEYIVWVNGNITHNVPILHKRSSSAHSLPNNYFTHEFRCTDQSMIPPVVALWDLVPLPVQQLPIAVLHRVRTPKEIPQRIAWILAEDASKKEDLCPITLEPISPLTAAVTSCFHVFDANAIASWFQTHSECPVCKTNCVTTVCFSEK